MIEIETSHRRRDHCESPAEVLSVLTGGDDQWIDYRGRRLGAWLAARGISHGWCLHGGAAWMAEEARRRGAKVILSEAQAIPPATISALAEALPSVAIVTLLHGAPSWCVSSTPRLTYDAIRQARDFPNVYLGVVSGESAMAWLPGAKIVPLPNPIEVPPKLTRSNGAAKETGEIVVSLVARPSPVKNWGGMLAALGILARKRKLRAVVAGRETTPNHLAHLDYLRDLGVDARILPFGDWAATLELIASETQVGLACGYSDSLNLVAAEHCLMGIPVVGSPALDWLPPSWRVSPQDPQAIADMAETLAASEKAGAQAKRIARAKAKENEKALIEGLQSLINRG